MNLRYSSEKAGQILSSTKTEAQHWDCGSAACVSVGHISAHYTQLRTRTSTVTVLAALPGAVLVPPPYGQWGDRGLRSHQRSQKTICRSYVQICSFFTQNQLIITNFSSTMSSYTHQNCYLEGINEGVRPLTGGKGGVASLPNILPPLRTAPAHFL